jgi:hypothetical protein
VLFALADDDVLLGGPATDGQFVYVSDQQGILAVPLDAEAGAAPIRVTSTFPVNSVGVFGRRIVFVQPQGAVGSVPLPPAPGTL